MPTISEKRWRFPGIGSLLFFFFWILYGWSWNCHGTFGMYLDAKALQWVYNEAQSLLEVKSSAIMDLVGAKQFMLYPLGLMSFFQRLSLAPSLLFQSWEWGGDLLEEFGRDYNIKYSSRICLWKSWNPRTLDQRLNSAKWAWIHFTFKKKKNPCITTWDLYSEDSIGKKTKKNLFHFSFPVLRVSITKDRLTREKWTDVYSSEYPM